MCKEKEERHLDIMKGASSLNITKHKNNKHMKGSDAVLYIMGAMAIMMILMLLLSMFHVL